MNTGGTPQSRNDGFSISFSAPFSPPRCPDTMETETLPRAFTSTLVFYRFETKAEADDLVDLEAEGGRRQRRQRPRKKNEGNRICRNRYNGATERYVAARTKMRDVDELTALPANPPAPLPSVPRAICSESVTKGSSSDFVLAKNFARCFIEVRQRGRGLVSSCLRGGCYTFALILAGIVQRLRMLG